MNTIPAFGVGTFRLQGQTVIDSVRNALDVGYRAIDTAQIQLSYSTVTAPISNGGLRASAAGRLAHSRASTTLPVGCE